MKDYSIDKLKSIMFDLRQAYDEMIWNSGPRDFICHACKYDVTQKFIQQHVYAINRDDTISLGGAYWRKHKKSMEPSSIEWAFIRNTWHNALLLKVQCMIDNKPIPQWVESVLLFKD